MCTILTTDIILTHVPVEQSLFVISSGSTLHFT